MDMQSFPPILTLEQAALYLQLSEDQLRDELESGRIPSAKIASQWRIRKDILDRLLEQPRETNSPPSASIESKKTAITTPQTIHPMPGANLETNAEPNTNPNPAKPELVQPLQSSSKTDELVVTSASSIHPIILDTTVNKTNRVRGRVFGYNVKDHFGHARLADNRVVWIDAKQMLPGEVEPFFDDVVEFDLHTSPKYGLQARAIRVIRKGEKPSVSNTEFPTQTGTAIPAIQSTSSRSNSIPTSKNKPPKGGTFNSREIYEKAAIARTEGRIDDARRLFRQSIEAGGGTLVYETFFKMEVEKGTRLDDARRIITQGIETFPDHAPFFDLYGHVERRSRHYSRAVEIFREGLERFPRNVQLRKGLAQALVQIGTEQSFKEAGETFEGLAREGKLNPDDRLYQRFRILQRNPLAYRAYEFFARITGVRVGVGPQRGLPPRITDIVAEINNSELNESFGLTGAFLVRCFNQTPDQSAIKQVATNLRLLENHAALNLIDRQVVLNPGLAFIVVPNIDSVRDRVMSILSEGTEVIVPLDQNTLQDSEDALNNLRELLGTYLGSRDLYNSTLPVSGRRFFGREKLLVKITDQVHNGEFLGVYGLRKMGKTSLVYQLRDEKLQNDAVAYVDLQASAAITLGDCAPLYWELERDLYLRLYEKEPTTASILRLGRMNKFTELSDGSERIRLVFAEDIRALLDALYTGEISSVKRLVIVLDELERLLPIAGQSGANGYIEFFGLLRGLAQTERYRNLISCVVVAANSMISEQSYWEGRENPVFALYKPIYLSPLEKDECTKMIRTLGKGMSIYWDDEAIETVFAETAGHPFLTRIFCSRVARQYPTRPLTITAVQVQEQITPFIRDEGDKLRQIIELLHKNFPEEVEILEKIALDETPYDISDESLRHLLDYSLIAPSESTYRVTLNLLRRWIRHRAGIRE